MKTATVPVTKPPDTLTDQALDAAMADALAAEDFERFEQLAAEADRREAQRIHHDPDRYARKLAIADLRAQGHTGRGLTELARSAFRDHVAQQYARAEDDCNGVMLNHAAEGANVRAARRNGALIDPAALFTGPAARFQRHASPEFIEWVEANGRPHFPTFAALLLDSARAQLAASIPDYPPTQEEDTMTTATPAAPARPVRKRPGGARVLDAVRSYVDMFCELPTPEALDAVTLWVAHTHGVDNDGILVFPTTPRLAILSRGPGSGKTRLLDVVSRLAKHGKMVVGSNGYGLANVVARRAVPCIDEIDKLFGAGGAKQDVQQIINAGYRPGTEIIRGRNGRDSFDPFGPIALAGMAQTFRTSADLRPTFERSIVVEMRPSAAKEVFRERLHGPYAAKLNESLSQWGQAASRVLADAFPDMPDGVDMRLEDVWSPLLAVGDAAGADWPARARAACRLFALGQVDVDDVDEFTTPTDALLAGIARVWHGDGDNDRLSSAELVERLQRLPGFQWDNLLQGQHDVGMMLRAIGVRARQWWAGKDDSERQTVRGYRWGDLVPHLPELDEDTAGVGGDFLDY